MNQNNIEFLKNMNIKNDIVVINQTNYNQMRIIKNETQKIKFISVNEKGLSKSRNMAIENSRADICVLADDDFKYYDNNLSQKYSSCSNYFECASSCIKEMYRQVGRPKFDNKGMMKRGVIVRHLILPGSLDDSKRVIKYLYDTYKDNIFISIMNQYTPLRYLEFEVLNRKLNDDEYDEIINYAYDLGVRKAFIQEGETQSESFIPDFSEFNCIK